MPDGSHSDPVPIDNNSLNVMTESGGITIPTTEMVRIEKINDESYRFRTIEGLFVGQPEGYNGIITVSVIAGGCPVNIDLNDITEMERVEE